jgi:hypothetical protein
VGQFSVRHSGLACRIERRSSYGWFDYPGEIIRPSSAFEGAFLVLVYRPDTFGRRVEKMLCWMRNKDPQDLVCGELAPNFERLQNALLLYRRRQQKPTVEQTKPDGSQNSGEAKTSC